MTHILWTQQDQIVQQSWICVGEELPGAVLCGQEAKWVYHQAWLTYTGHEGV